MTIRLLWIPVLAAKYLFFFANAESVSAEVKPSDLFLVDPLEMEQEALGLDEKINCSEDDGYCQSSDWPECGVWLAMSTIPNSGLGMFAGKAFEEGDLLMDTGDHVVPIVDFQMNQGDDVYLVWDEYTWNPDVMRAESEGLSEVTVCSFGFGAAANSFLDFVNVDEGTTVKSVPDGMHRSNDPGIGAFTQYHSRMAKAQTQIEPGQELFVSYGSHWYVHFSWLRNVSSSLGTTF